MGDVFLSYARPDEAQAERVADALRSHGYDVWRDDELPAHRAYADVIQERLKSAKAVVVLWSVEAARSQWVRSEADAARQLGTVVQARLDGTIPPMPFDQIQCADLGGWDGKAESPGWRKLEASVRALAGTAMRASSRARASDKAVSICVLPFVNMSGDAEQEYFSDGISEDITTDLSKVSALEVIARNTAFQFKGQSPDVREVASKLGVTHVLEGSVRKAGGRVRITAQLIDGSSGAHLWADRYDRDLTDIFAIQDELSHAIVDALKVKLLPEEKKAIEDRGTENVEAYNLYLMARQTWQNGTHGDTRREKTVIRLCDRIIAMAPDYGKAWALKAIAETTLFFGYNQGTIDGLASADRALELDPTAVDAYCAKARALADRRQWPEAENAVHAALSLDPSSWEANKQAASIYVWQQKFPEAARHYRKCVELDPAQLFTWEMLAMACRAMDDEEGVDWAASQLLKHATVAIERDPSNCSAFARGANAHVMLGNFEQGREWIERAILIDPDNLDIRYNFVCTLINHTDEFDLIFEMLKYVFARSVGSIVRRADLDPDLDRIRDHPRFKEIYASAMERISKLDAEKAKSAATPPAAASEPLRS